METKTGRIPQFPQRPHQQCRMTRRKHAPENSKSAPPQIRRRRCSHRRRPQWQPRLQAFAERDTRRRAGEIGGNSDAQDGGGLDKEKLDGRGMPVFSADESNRPWGLTDNARLSFGKNTIVIGARGTIGSVKLPAVASFTCTQTTIAASVVQGVSPEFVAYFLLQSHSFHTIARGSKIPMITIANVAKISIPLPPLSEQRVIARTLKARMRTAAKIRAVAQAQLAAADALPSAWLRRVFSVS